MGNLLQQVIILVGGACIYWLIEYVRSKIWSDDTRSTPDLRYLKEFTREMESMDIDSRLKELEEYVRRERRRRAMHGDVDANN